jgi:hypothetical protein
MRSQLFSGYAIAHYGHDRDIARRLVSRGGWHECSVAALANQLVYAISW